MTDTPSAILTADELSSTLRRAGFLTKFSLINSGFSGIDIRSGSVEIGYATQGSIISMADGIDLSISSKIIENHTYTDIIFVNPTSRSLPISMEAIPSKLSHFTENIAPGRVVKYQFSFPADASGVITSSTPFTII